MENNQNKQVNQEEPDIDASFKNAFYMAFIFVGGGLVLFWLYLFAAYAGRV